MTRRLVWWSTAAVALVVLLATSVWTRFDHVPQTVRTQPEPAAQRDRYLALGRVLSGLNRPLELTQNPAVLDHLDQPGVVILDRGRARILTSARLAHLLRWVDAGGHLIVPVESGDNDTLMRVLGVQLQSRPAPTSGAASSTRAERTVMRVQVSGMPEPLTAFIGPFGAPLKPGDGAHPDWSAGNSSGPYVLHFSRGQGAVTVTSAWPALTSNGTLGRADNAAVAWVLLNLVHRAGPIQLVDRVHVQTLWEWLRESAWTVLISAALLLLIWLWRIMPRLGPLTPATLPDRRALVEHLRAMGRAVWRAKEEEGLRYWLQCVRRSVLTRALQVDPALARLTPAEQASRIGQRVASGANLDPRQVRTALAGVANAIDGAVAREGFTQVVAILQRVESHL